MKRSRFSEEQVAFALRQVEAGAPVGDVGRARDQSALRLRIRELAHARPRFEFLRIWVLLRREGWGVNRKRVRRLYRLDGLQVRMRVRRRKHMALHPDPAPPGPCGTLEHGFRA